MEADVLYGRSPLLAAIVSPPPPMTAPGPLRLMSNAAGIRDKKERGGEVSPAAVGPVD